MRARRRIEVVFELVNREGLVVADIGCDHGYLERLLCDGKKVKKVIATDISEPSLEKTRKLIAGLGLKNVETRVGAGLDPLSEGEADIVVIAGMGGREIIKILNSEKAKSFKNIVLQPANNVELVRRFLTGNYKIIKDFIVKDQNKFYNILEAVLTNSKQNLSEEEIEFGLTDFDLYFDDYLQYLDFEEERIENILKTNFNEKLSLRLKKVKELKSQANKRGEKNARNSKISRDR